MIMSWLCAPWACMDHGLKSDIPKVVTICFAMLLTCCRSPEAPVVTSSSPKTTTSAKRPHDAREDLLLGDQGGVLPRREPGETLGLPAGHDGDLLHGVVARGESAADGVPNLVVGHEALALAVGQLGALHACHDAVDRVVDLRGGDRVLVAAPREDGR